jgi:folate-binding protein YgfZ
LAFPFCHGVGSVPRQNGNVDAAPQLDDSNFIDPAARDQVEVAGSDALTYLQSQIAQEIRSQEIGETQWTLVLDPAGKIDALARITRTGGETFVLDTDAGFGEQLAARINRFKIRVDADVTLKPAETNRPSDAHEAARIAAGWPRMGCEIVPGETIPVITGVLDLAVNFTKGCYPGQELVERMDSRGADAPQSLRILTIADGASTGDPVEDAAGNDVGRITSIAPGGGLALGYVKRGSDVGQLPPHQTP